MFALISLTNARMTREERKRIKEEADRADLVIKFGDFDTVDSIIQKHKTFLLFFGANWCPNTQK
jgi:hypothetical protein